MKLLVISFYYSPDLSAGSFRCTALVRALSQVPGVEVEVLTTEPNRYSGYQAEVAGDAVDGVTVKRFPLPNHKSDIRGQVLAYCSFARQVLNHVKARDYDMVFATSSRLMTAVLAARIARKSRLPLYLDIRDIFVDTLASLYSNPIFKPLLWGFSILERYAISYASRVNIVSPGFRSYFKSRYAKLRLSEFTNGIDSEFISADRGSESQKLRSGELKTLLYAGNVGDGQGLHLILPAMADLLPDVEIIVVGAGGRLEALKVAASESAGNITILPPVSRQELLGLYGGADVLFLHLNDVPAFERVLPSKLFEYAATGKPILAGVSGFAAQFIEANIVNAEVFPPQDSVASVAALKSLQFAEVDRESFVEEFQRKNIMRGMALDVLGVIDT